VPDVEAANLREIEALNQRGGRTLSIVDLILADTISVEAAAHVGAAVGRGASLLTAANPGGAGKTALLAALLGFLPRERAIVPVGSPEAVAAGENERQPRCYLAHEIGAGHWYGYIWGPIVGRYLALADGPHTVASCLHADTMEEIADTMLACSLPDARAALRAIDFILFMHIDRKGGGFSGHRRRVAAIYQRDEAGSHRPIFRWDPDDDSVEALDPPPLGADGEALGRLLADLASSGTRDFGAVRRAYLDSLS
jgi:hypothetical protein